MPVRVADLLADTMHMSTEEFGAYCRLLFSMWQHGGALNDNPKTLATIAGVTPDVWKTIAETVTKPLSVAGGLVSQKRLMATLIEVREKRERRAGAAARRWAR